MAAFVQNTGKSRVSNGASVTMTFSTTPSVGSLILVGIDIYSTEMVNGDVTDNQGNTYLLAGQAKGVSGGPGCAIFYAVAATASGTFTITVNPTSVGNTYIAASAHEWSGTWTGRILDRRAYGYGSGTAIATRATDTLRDANEVVAAICAIGANQASLTVASATPAWDERHEELSWTSYCPGEFNSRVLSGSTAGQSCSWTAATSAAWAACIVTFREAATDIDGLRYPYMHNHGATGGNGYYYDCFGGSGPTNSFVNLSRAASPVDGTVRDLRVRLATAPGVGASRTFTFYVDGATTGVSVTISGTSTTASATGTLLTLLAGQSLHLVETTSGSPAASTSTWVNFEIVTFTAGEYGCSGPTATLVSGSTYYANPFHGANLSTTAMIGTAAVASPCMMTALVLAEHYIGFGASPSITAMVQRSTDGGATFVDQDGSGGTPDTRVTMVGPTGGQPFIEHRFSLTLNRGDLVRVRLSPSASGINHWFSIGGRFVASNTGEANWAAGRNPSNSASASAVNYASPRQIAGLNWSSSQGDTLRLYGPVGGCTLSDPYGFTTTAPGSGLSRTLDVMVNGSATPPSFVLTGATSPAVADGSGSQALTDGDYWIIRHTPQGTPNVTTSPRWTYVLWDGSIVPTSVDDAYTTPFETQLVVAAAGVLANDDANGGGAMTALLVDDVGVGTLALASDGSFTYDPPLGFSGVVTFTYRAVSEVGAGTIATVTITVLTLASTAIPVILEMRFGDGYRSLVRNHPAIAAHWYLSDAGAVDAVDEIEANDPGVYEGTVPARGLLPEFGLSRRFNGVDEWVAVDFDQFGIGADSPLSVSAVVRVDAIGATQCIIRSSATGLWLGVDATGHFAFGRNGGTKATSATALTLDTTYHVVGTYDGTNAWLYVDGVLAAGPTAVSLAASTGTGYIGKNASEEFDGDIQGVALFYDDLSAGFVLDLYEATQWTDVSDWARGTVPITTQRGIQGDDPRQRLAPTGTARFGLNNFEIIESGANPGYWSPGHANCREGFQRGIPVRISFDTGIQFIGSLRDIKPSAGVFEDRVTMCFCTDWMDEAARFTLDGIETQANITADDAIRLLLDRMPNKPHELSLGVGTDTFEIALDSTQKNQKVQQELGRLAASDLGFVYVTGDGTLVFEPRGSRISGSATSVATIDNEQVQTDVDHTTDQILNSVRITVHPRRVDTGATTVLYTTDTRVRIDNGVDGVEMFFPFRDPAQEAAAVAGINVNTPVANTDYTLNTAQDGSGANVTTDPSIAVAWRIDSRGIYLIVTNNYGLPVYLDLEVTGDGIYNFTPVTTSVDDDDLIRQIGIQDVEIDMPYQSSAAVAVSAAQWLLNTYADEASRLRSIRFRPTTPGNLTLFSAALDVELGSRVTIAEDLTAIDGDFFVNAIQHTWVGEGQVMTQWWLARANTQDFWVMDVSELDITTRLSY